MTKTFALLFSCALFAFSPVGASENITVVTSIKPVHSLVAAVMDGVGTPHLIIDGGASPHTYSLKPSQAARLEQAQIIFWVGPQLEAFLEKPVHTIGHDAVNVELVNANGLIKLPLRSGGDFEAHAHEDHDEHEKHEHAQESHESKHKHETHEGEHKHEAHEDEHKHEAHEDEHKQEHKGHADHDTHASEETFNAHVWLDPENAGAFIRMIESSLAEADPANAQRYRTNAAAALKKLDVLAADTQTMLAPVKGKPFIVFHDAYQYFENRFGLTAAGSITVSPEIIPGAERIGEIRAKVAQLDATCVFAEPQFEPKLVSVVTEGTNAKSGTLDPLGSELEAGPDLYFELIQNMATSIKDCLSESPK